MDVWLQERRETLGWSQRQMAERVGMSRTTLWRDGTKPRKISAQRLIRLSRALRKPLPESVARLVGSVGYEETDDARRLREATGMVDEALKGAQLAAVTLAEMKALLVSAFEEGFPTLSAGPGDDDPGLDGPGDEGQKESG